MRYLPPRQLDVFVHAADSGSLRRAAERLHLTQPAASMALAELERALGGPLFARVRGRLRLNPRGQRLLPLARELLERQAELVRAAHDETAVGGELRVGASNTVGNYLIGELLGGFVRAHPQVQLRLQVGNTEAILAALAEHRLDAACVEGPVAAPTLASHPWRRDRLVVCAAPDHPLARRRRLRAQDFAGQRWILRERGSATRQLGEQALAALPAPAAVLELDQTEAVKQAVAAGLGLAWLPEVAVRDAVACGRLRVLATPFLALERQLRLAWRREDYRSPALAALLDGLAADAA
ncbi:LysR family transcriptional regulator [Thermomonas flagellata]|uniref:LysR family transcriptional regulator n=1 Tax=Thermomonas flagellata TaxID=2888524 RepID=UPI001F03DB69|nr:LysR family transcriptional regulator [Thermomonas flagellata]